MEEEVQTLTQTTEELTTTAIEMAMGYGPRVVLAMVTLVIGLWMINRFVRVISRTMEARRLEPSLAGFLRNLASIGLKILLLISVASMVGIATTSFIAVLGAAGLAVGLALQGSLANFAGGVLVLLFRPFRVGEMIEAQGFFGTVHEIQIFHTVVKTFDNRTIIVPNGALSNDLIINLSREQNRRAEWTFGVSYEDDMEKVRNIILEQLHADERVLTEPAPTVVLASFGDSSVNFMARAWVNADELWPLTWDINARVKKAFDEADITIPFPQRDVHFFSTDDK